MPRKIKLPKKHNCKVQKVCLTPKLVSSYADPFEIIWTPPCTAEYGNFQEISGGGIETPYSYP